MIIVWPVRSMPGGLGETWGWCLKLKAMLMRMGKGVLSEKLLGMGKLEKCPGGIHKQLGDIFDLFRCLTKLGRIHDRERSLVESVEALFV